MVLATMHPPRPNARHIQYIISCFYVLTILCIGWGGVQHSILWSDYATMYMLQLQLLVVDNNYFESQTILLAGALL